MRTLFVCLLLAACASSQTTAPPPQNVGGCQPLPADSVFYQPVDQLPVLAQSSTFTANMGATVALTWDSSLGVTIIDGYTPAVALQFAYTPSANGPFPFPAPLTVERQNGSLAGAIAGDQHTIVVNRSTCDVWETYHYYALPGVGTVGPTQTCSGRPCNAQSGFHYSSTTYALPAEGTTDAAGLPLLPLLWRGQEIKDGVLNHAVRLTLARGYIEAGHPAWPANGGNGWGDATHPPYGTRLRLSAAAAAALLAGPVPKLPTVQQAYAKTVVAALARFGLVVADIGLTNAAAIDMEAGEDPDVVAALAAVGANIKPPSFEVVDSSSLQSSPLSYRAAGASPNVPNPPVLVGTPYATFLNVQAGAAPFALSAWVTGPIANRAVVWRASSAAIGTVTAAGMYSPPATSSGIVQGVLTAAASALPSAVSNVYVRILPPGPIRVAAGLRSGTLTDKLGQVWLPNLFLRGGDNVYRSGDSPAWPTPADATQAAELPVYQTFSYTYGNDQVGEFRVPNAPYRVHLLLAQPYNSAKPASCSPFPATWHNFVGLEAQGALIARNYDFGAGINHACATPVDAYLPALVTDGRLEFALRNMQPDGGAHPVSVQISGFEIAPDPSPTPHVAIDTQQQSSLKYGASLQCYAVGWYMPSDVAWRVDGPGSITSDGLYTAPASPPATVSAPVAEIVATSKTDPTKVTSAHLTLTP